jgi:hypothetical protein
LAEGDSKGVKLANHEDSPRITRGDLIESFVNMETGKPKDGSLQESVQEGIPVCKNLRGVMSSDHADSLRVTQGDRLEQCGPTRSPHAALLIILLAFALLTG